MKKTFRSFALAVLAAIPVAATAQLYTETVWQNGVVNGVANPIPGLDAKWDKPTPSHVSTATASRFAVGKDGKIITTNHITNELVAWDGKEFTTFYKLPAVTTEKWNGTCVTTDDAGNVVFNYCFTDAQKSLQYWGVIDKDGQMTDVNLSTPLADLNVNGRLDIMSHIVGDVTSEEGGIGYSTIKSTNHLVMFHFKGDGKKVTSVTAKASSDVDKIALCYAETQTEVWQPAPKYLTVAELLKGNPENNFYLPVGIVGNGSAEKGYPIFSEGILANFEGTTYAPLTVGNRGYASVATFMLGGKKYIIRNFVSETSPYVELLSAWKNVMAFGIFDEQGTLYATWEGSTFTSGFGDETINVEVVDEHTVNVYLYVATVGDDKASGTIEGSYAAMVRVSDIPTADGSIENPYVIASAEDLCNAWSKTVTGKLVYFKQTADIDMADVKEFTALTGYDSDYNKSIYYDGGNHVIKNFAPVDRIAGSGANAYYCTTIFGTPSGTIKNLGVVDAEINTEWYEAGVLGGFAGTGAQTATTALNIDNVFVTGKIKNTKPGTISGGMFATSGQPLNVTNSYVQIEIDGADYVGGFMAKATKAVTISNSYASAILSGTTKSLVAGADNAEVKFTNVVAFGEGQASNVATSGATVVPAGDASGIATVKSWSAFNEGKLFNGLPALNWQDVSTGITDIELDNEGLDVPAVYYNLQGVQVANPESGIYIVRRGNKVTKEYIAK